MESQPLAIDAYLKLQQEHLELLQEHAELLQQHNDLHDKCITLLKEKLLKEHTERCFGES